MGIHIHQNIFLHVVFHGKLSVEFLDALSIALVLFIVVNLDEDYSDIESSNEKLMLEEFAVSLEFAPLTNALRISNIPQGTSSDAIKFRFSNRKAGGNKVCDMKLDKDNGIAIVYFEEPSGIPSSLSAYLEFSFEFAFFTVS